MPRKGPRKRTVLRGCEGVRFVMTEERRKAMMEAKPIVAARHLSAVRLGTVFGGETVTVVSAERPA